MPPTKARPTATVASVVASTPERGIPRTTHLRFASDHALRRAFETGQIPGTMDEFCAAAIDKELEALTTGILASDPDFQLAMYYARREREDTMASYNTEQAYKTIHSAKQHIVLYAKMRDKKSLAAFVTRRWEATEKIPIEFWRDLNQSMFRDEVLYWVVKGMVKLGYSIPVTLRSYLGV